MGPSLPPDFSQNISFPQADAGRAALLLSVCLGIGEVASGTLGRVGLESVRGAPPPYNSAVVSSPDSDSAQGSDVSLTGPKGETLWAGSGGHGNRGTQLGFGDSQSGTF